MATLKQDAKKAALLLDSQELSGWDLAELCARRVLSSNHPSDVELQRELGRVSAQEWAELVTQNGRRRMVKGTAGQYARCWRRYGERTNRLHDEDGSERTFAEHFSAAGGAEDQAEERIVRFQGRTSSWEPAAPRDQQTVSEQAQQLPPEHRAAVARQMLEDPEVAERVLADDQTALNIVKARAKHAERRVAEQDQAQRMRAPNLVDAGDLAETGNNMAHIATRLELLAEQVQRVPADQRQQFAREWADVKRLVGWVDSVLSGESMDEGLSKLLNGGNER